MAKGDFNAKVRGNIKTVKCESCGKSDWRLIEEGEQGATPVIVNRFQDGSLAPGETGTPVILAVCESCRYIRIYANH